MIEPIYQKREITTYKNKRFDPAEDPIVIEKPLTLFLNHVELVTMVCSSCGLEELGVGFLISEGLIHKPSDIADLRCNEKDGLLWVETSCPSPQTSSFLHRHMTSCCGKGRAGLFFINDARDLKPVESNTLFTAPHLLTLMQQLEDQSNSFKATGGVHSAALGDHVSLQFFYEDIGRHNAVDKVLGRAFLDNVDCSDKCLLLSGRVASEILIKAARSNVPFLLSRSAPTDLTVDLAEELGITVVGFARGKQLNIYSHPENVLL